MIIDFRQGIVSFQSSPTHLSFSGGTISIFANNDPFIVTIADGDMDYLHQESENVSNAWVGPFSMGTDYWLYIDLDTQTGVRTFGTTTYEPTYGDVRPTTPDVGEHFFDNIFNYMVVWNGMNWDRKIRIFVGKLESGNTLIPFVIGTQVDIEETINVGYILRDNGGFIRRQNGQFLTTETPVYSIQNQSNDYLTESQQIRMGALSTIRPYQCVSICGDELVDVSTYASLDIGECIGLASTTIAKGDVGIVIVRGKVTNTDWNFTEPAGTSLFVGSNGEVTTNIPKRISFQKIGQVIDATTIFLDINSRFVLSEFDVSVTPSPTQTITPTPSLTPP